MYPTALAIAWVAHCSNAIESTMLMMIMPSIDVRAVNGRGTSSRRLAMGRGGASKTSTLNSVKTMMDSMRRPVTVCQPRTQVLGTAIE